MQYCSISQVTKKHGEIPLKIASSFTKFAYNAVKNINTAVDEK